LILLKFYTGLTKILTPLIRAHVARRARAGKEDPSRLNERWGMETTPRPFAHHPLWVHAASVGETYTALAIIQHAHHIMPDLPMILTTGTVTSARMVAARLPKNTVHRYAPYDHPDWIAAFLDHWQPRAAVRVEAEIWPNTLLALKDRGIQTALMNAHLSRRSFARWHLARRSAQALMTTFRIIMADGPLHAERYRALGATNVTAAPNLKFMSPPLPVHAPTAEALRAAIGPRPVWLYASTHADEEKIAARVHERLKSRWPKILTIIAPRHPERVADIAQDLESSGWSVALRSRTPTPDPTTDLFIIDTMGELGTIMSVVPITMVGRSLSRDGGGGHNPIEPALIGSYPLAGPRVQNLQTIYDTLIAAKACTIVPHENALADEIDRLLGLPDLATLATHTQRAVAQTASQVHVQVETIMMMILKS
jgi:3-deoxy-D-manno-octulosonic-acid transferase